MPRCAVCPSVTPWRCGAQAVLREDGEAEAHELLQALGVGDDGHRARMIEALRAEDTDGAGS
jgi:hypothetical protein